MALRLSTGLRNAMGGGFNLVANPNFTIDNDPPTSWTASTATLSTEASGQSGNCMKVLGNGSAGYAYQSVATKVGHVYAFSIYYQRGDATNAQVEVGTSAGDATHYDSGNVTSTSWTQLTTAFIATTTTTFITCNTDATAVYNNYDTVVLREVGSVADFFKNGNIKIYSGTQPTEADDVATGTLLVTVNNAGSGITFSESTAGVLSIKTGETWSGVCASTGTAGWFRLMCNEDLGTDNTTDVRLDGSVATSGGQLNFSSTSFTSGATQTITSFAVTVPAS